MAGRQVCPIVSLQWPAGTGYRYAGRKNRRNVPDRLRLRTYDPMVRRHVVLREGR